MNAKQEISKVGIAIERARSIIDEAMPRKQNPFLPDYEYARLAPLFALAHWGIENGLKAILSQQKIKYPRGRTGHNLGELIRLSKLERFG